MNKFSLVYIKETNGGFTNIGIPFKPHTPYRCMIAEDNDEKEFLVYGEVFDEKTFNELFEFAYNRIMRHFETLGLVHISTNGGIKPIGKKEFIERGYAVKYGKGKDSFWTLYYYTHPKELMYRFSPTFSGGSKAVQMTNLYNDFIELVNGNLQAIDDNEIEFGNCGLPLGQYKELDVRFVPEKFYINH